MRRRSWRVGRRETTNPSEWAFRRWIGAGLAVMFALIGVALVVQVLFRPNAAGGNGSWFFGWGWGLLGLLVFLWLMGWIFRSWAWPGPYRYRTSWGWDRPDPADILRMRYARGEITKEQFDAMMRDIGK